MNMKKRDIHDIMASSSVRTRHYCNSNDFRSTSVYPKQEELLETPDLYLKKNIVKGKFRNVDQYLEIHFRLLREDFVASLRDGIKKYRLNKRDGSIGVYENVDIAKRRQPLYRNFRYDIEFEYYMTINNVKFENLANSKKFLNGSLLIFTKNDFKTIHLAKVVFRQKADFEKNTFFIKFVDETVTGKNFTMAEPPFFEPYFQVLTALQNITPSDLPMQKYIIKAQTSTTSLPRYLQYKAAPQYKINKKIFDLKRPQTFSLDCLNEAQLRAFKAALTNEFVVIQGPPGTGKTFLGLEIVKALLQNHQFWYHKSPILVISHKNHALDQFLEGLIPVTEQLVRVGLQCKSKLLRRFILRSDIDDDSEDENGDVVEHLKRLDLKSELEILQKALVVGMTTTCAARMRSTLEELQCPIVVVEEAAEVLEAHVVAALNSSCQHLILLGDHKQLQPTTSDQKIGQQYHLGLSLFERMVNNGIQCYQLEVQHRMRPEIANLLRATVYPFLQDHHSVKTKPSVDGVTKNVFFIEHCNPEKTCYSTSKENAHEAEFLIAFARYLILNGHNAEDIAVLTTYSGQVRRLNSEVQKLAIDKSLFYNVRISTLDGFQGQEAEIVLLSLVRSDSIGFLSTENRICVALSRAKKGYYIIGNMNLLARKSKMWSKIQVCLQNQQAIGTQLVLQCQRHPDTKTNVNSKIDFFNVMCGGCNKFCLNRLPCGHVCGYRCHVYDTDHANFFSCTKICKRKICKRHPSKMCSRKCGSICEKCDLKVMKRFTCGHVLATECSTEECPKGCS